MELDPEPSSLIIFSAFQFSHLFVIVGMLFFLFCSALLSGAEVSLFGLTPVDFEGTKKEASRKRQIIIDLLDRPKKLLATILITNNFSNIAFVLLFDYFGSFVFVNLDMEIFGFSVRFLVEIIIATFLLMLITETIPKILANRRRMEFSEFVAYPLAILDRVLAPFSLPMRAGTNFIHKKLGKKGANLSVDHLSHALELTREEDTTQEEQKILKGIVSFGNIDAKEVMRPRMDIFALNQVQLYPEVISEIKEHGYSRIPVYEENIDNIMGVLYAKDLLPHINKKKFDWAELIREPYFVPENMKLDDLLNEFKYKKNHLAIVVDEYGGTSGLISLEDVIEEIVGDINDEFDDEDLIYSKLDENNYVFEGKTTLKEFYKVIQLEDISLFEENKGEAETLAGFLLEISKSFPKKNDPIVFENYTFTVEIISDKRLKQIKLNIAPR